MIFVFVRNSDDTINYAAITVFASAGSNALNLLHSKEYFRIVRVHIKGCVKHLKPILIIFASNIAIMIYVYIRASDMMESILCGTNYDGYLWNKIFQRKIIENNNLRFQKNIVVWEDLLFVLQYLKNCDKVTISDEKLYYYRYREGSAVNNTRLDKYRSKYEVMKKIKEQDFSYTKQSRKKRLFCTLKPCLVI